MTRRIRIFFINCPSLAIDAAGYLIVAQNRTQTAIQFEVHHFWIYGKHLRGSPRGLRAGLFSYNEDGFHSFAQLPRPLSRWLEPLSRWLERKNRTRLDLIAAPKFKKGEFRLSEALDACREAITNHDDWFENSSYNRYDTHRGPAIVVTETPLWGKYISNCGADVAVLSAAKWEDFFRPASGLEYVLTGIQRLSLRLVYGSNIGSHYPTRGCLWDFHVHQPDSKISSFLGFLCETCRANLQKATSPTEFHELMALMGNDWLGAESDSSSVAGILKKNYRYSLTRSKGLHPGIFATVGDSMKSEFGRFFVEIIKWSLIVLITLFFLTYFPNLTQQWKEFVGGPNENTPRSSHHDQKP